MNVLRELNWVPQDKKTDRTFKEAFSFITEPYPLQNTIDIMSEKLENAGMVIIEAPMGEGKTEAALFLMERMNRRKNYEKVYIGMPTHATSNQMYRRVRKYILHRKDITRLNLSLVHGHAVMSNKLKQIKVSSVGDEEDNIAANEWFTYKKRGILSPYGVGTIDQSLLAILSVKHFYVRLFGLAGKTVIFDEVHAYDVYMSTLLDRLLKWLSALNTNVIILSATLPSDRKNQLLKAYSGKSGVKDVAYPRISWTYNDNIYAKGFSSASEKHGRPSRVHLQFIDQDIYSLAHRLNDTLSEGGKVAVICNTVKKAQNMYVELKSLLDEDIDIDILHARYMLKDRKRREEKCLDLFGKGIAPDDSKYVLVSTQIIEQSLDLDFDLMITELAPIDLLIQRSGRLHRHSGKKRPPRLESPSLLILRPEFKDGAVPDFGSSSCVYSEYVLLKSYLLLKNKEMMCIPDDIEAFVEAVYVDDIGDCPPHLIDPLKKVKEEWYEEKKDMQKKAELRIIGSPDFDRPWKLMANLLKEDDPETHKMLVASTRLAPPSVSLICLFETPNGLALDEEGLQTIDITKQPMDEEVPALLDNSISLSNKRIVEHLLQERVPESWKRSSLLNRYRAIVFQKDDMSETYIYKSGNIYIIHDKNIGIYEG
jgi:CRISPR-associated endonuclease/helicase Cas3